MTESKPERRTSIGAQRNPQSQKAILEAAEAILAESGPKGFSIEAVARRAKAGKPTIYRWWPSRTALLIDVYQRLKPVAYPDTGTIEGDIAGFLTQLLTFWRGPGGTFFRTILAEAQTDPDALAALQAYVAGRHVLSNEVIARGQARGEIRPDLPIEMASELISGFIWRRLLTNRLDMSATEIETFANLVVCGLRPR